MKHNLNNTIIKSMMEDCRGIERITGYYWVKFPHSDREPNWEPGSWDNRSKTWALIGSDMTWIEFQLMEIGYFITEHMIGPRYSEVN
jgi:hypothetical protein